MTGKGKQMKITKRQLRRIIRESIYGKSQTAGPPISGRHAIALGGDYGKPPSNPDPKLALAAAKEMGYDPSEHPALDSNNIAINDALAAYPGEFTYDDIIAAVRASGGIVNEAYGAIGSGDPAQEILDWAEEGNRVTIAGKNIWVGLGSRSGLHSYADEVIGDKWSKSGDRFTKKVMNLPAGTEVELKRFQSSSRGRGNWVTAGTVTTTGPLKGSGGEAPSAKRMRQIGRELSDMYDRDVKIKSVSKYVGDDEPFLGKNWEVVVGKERMIFPNDSGNPAEYAQQEAGFWEIYSTY
jgi:hypothetical protein|tara:strand:+ start:342 stop:1226 length:885 start_codon:yes stop_codon:yes gene_type:complete